MSLLASRFREEVSKNKDFRMKNEVEVDVAYPSGFLSFDFLNGTVVHVKSKEKQFSYNSIGIVDGSMVTVIGRSGCGKTTWIIQTSANIVRPFEKSCIFHDDIEGGIVQSRKEHLMKMSGEELESKYICRNSGITAENFYERIKLIHDLKMQDRAEYEYDTGLYSSSGKRIYKLAPTVYILDSLAMLMPEKYTEEEELSGQMSATAAAKTNSSIFKRIIPMLKAANIILFVVNHITEDVSINPMVHKKTQIAYLKQGETLGGGRVAVYLSNLLLRFDDNSKLQESDSFGVHGIMVDVTLLKSRTSAAGRSVPLVFDYDNGFDPELSLFVLLKEMGYVKGAGAYLYFGDDKDKAIKFSQKQFKTKLSENPELQQIFASTCMTALQSLITKSEVQEDYDNNTFDITQSILQINSNAA